MQAAGLKLPAKKCTNKNPEINIALAKRSIFPWTLAFCLVVLSFFFCNFSQYTAFDFERSIKKPKIGNFMKNLTYGWTLDNPA